MLTDRPTGNLDPTNSRAVFQALHDLVRGPGGAAVVATYNIEVAGHMDRVFALVDATWKSARRPRVLRRRR